MNILIPLIAAAAFHWPHPLGITRNVATINDSGEGSLRQAIIQSKDGDAIVIDPSIEEQTITLSSGSLLIDKSVEIHGPITITRATNARFRIFDIQFGTVVLSDLTISNGYADGSFGGGISNRTTLLLQRCRVTDNISDAGDGGGGIWNTGYLTIQNSIIDHNQAIHTVGFPVGYGGGIKTSGTLALINSTVTTNAADLQGGGIFCNGMLTITQSTITGNAAPQGANIFGCVAHRLK